MQFSKPMLASDADLSKIKFPIIAQPKVDGVRGLIVDGELYGRSLKRHANKWTNRLFSQQHLTGLDGELFVGNKTDEALCRNTTSAVNRIEGEPVVRMVAFDWLHPDVIIYPYHQRLQMLDLYLKRLQDKYKINYPVEITRFIKVFSLEQLEKLDLAYLDQGYEGTIVRDMEGAYKSGRSTIKEGGLLRIKRFVEEDALVLELIEGNHNANEAKTNELGRTERSTHAENMIPNGLVGGLTCKCLKTGAEITVSPGRLTAEERKHYWDNPTGLVGKVIKYKHFPKGVKDKPRFPTFQSIRADSDKV